MDRVLAISPLDGRYFEQVNQLSFIVSEFALIKYRLIVEDEWFVNHVPNYDFINNEHLKKPMRKFLCINQ
jgi:hypothetical protein